MSKRPREMKDTRFVSAGEILAIQVNVKCRSPRPVEGFMIM
jgi:hypothetical protein